jgi:hypothetical protein
VREYQVKGVQLYVTSGLLVDFFKGDVLQITFYMPTDEEYERMTSPPFFSFPAKTSRLMLHKNRVNQNMINLLKEVRKMYDKRK